MMGLSAEIVWRARSVLPLKKNERKRNRKRSGKLGKKRERNKPAVASTCFSFNTSRAADAKSINAYYGFIFFKFYFYKQQVALNNSCCWTRFSE